MTCDEAIEHLNARQDGELDVEAAILLGGHLAGCPGCKECAEDYTRYAALARRLPVHPLEGTLGGFLRQRALERHAGGPGLPALRANPWNFSGARIDRRMALSAFLGAAAAALITLVTTWGLGLGWPRIDPAAAYQPPKSGTRRPADDTPSLNSAAGHREESNSPEPVAVAAPGANTGDLALETNRSRQPSSIGSGSGGSPNDTQPPPATESVFPFPEGKAYELLLEHAAILEYEKFKKLPEAEQKRRRRLRQVERLLFIPGQAQTAARELVEDKLAPRGQAVYMLAHAVGDGDVGREVFQVIASLEPELDWAPIYIAALEYKELRQGAVDRLCQVSGRKYGPSRERWSVWYAQARTAARNSEG